MGDIRQFERENTVSSEKQVSELILQSEEVGSPRILFVGNSITLHGVKPEIGWHWLWGMAASAKEKDYVHQTVRMVREIRPDAGYMIVQLANWERNYWKNEQVLDQMGAAREYDADIVVIRIGENIREQDLAEHELIPAFEQMIDYFNPSGRAKVIVTSLFWPNPAKEEAIRTAARNQGAEWVDLSHLGMLDEMKAIGLFEHAGVAAHPGDSGMLRIAESIFEIMKPMLRGE